MSGMIWGYTALSENLLNDSELRKTRASLYTMSESDLHMQIGLTLRATL